VVIETDAASAEAMLDVVRRLQQPLILAFNRGRLMVLPQGVAKSTGLRHALQALRLSIHNTIGIGDAENDHDLLDACEVGVAVAWGSAALRAVAMKSSRAAARSRLHPATSGSLASPLRKWAKRRARPILRQRASQPGGAAHRPDRGRGRERASHAGGADLRSSSCGAGMCIIDPEGDYQTLDRLPGVVTLGGTIGAAAGSDTRPPAPRRQRDRRSVTDTPSPC
jgi:hypothetical protein